MNQALTMKNVRLKDTENAIIPLTISISRSHKFWLFKYYTHLEYIDTIGN